VAGLEPASEQRGDAGAGGGEVRAGFPAATTAIVVRRVG
jgi:hypothetical protein